MRQTGQWTSIITHMRRAALWGGLLVLLAACAPAADPTPDPTAVAAAVQATLDAGAAPPPTLIEPEDGARFARGRDVVLRWDWARPLLDDEVYDVRVWREGEPNYGITWHRETTFPLGEWLAAQEPGEYFWSVAVLQVDQAAREVQANVSQQAPPRRFRVEDVTLPPPDELNWVLPPGFVSREYTPPVPTEQITVITFGPNERLYILTQAGDLYVASDTDDNDFAETLQPYYLDEEDRLQHAVGLAFYDGRVYISDSGRISTMEDADGDGRLDADTLTPIVTGLPSLEYISHSNNGIVFVDDMLYVAVGSTTDHGPIQREYEASILRMNPDGSDLEVFATGFRNPYDLTASPAGDLFTADNNPDQLSDRMRFFAPEELNHVRQGRHYGFPDVFGTLGDLGDTEPPVTEFFPSVATAGLAYYAADRFPPAYRDGVFVAQWGTAASTLLDRTIQNGRAVVFVALEPDGETYRGEWQPFAEVDPEDDFRPVDVTVGPDGALYVANFVTSRIYRIDYVGEEAAAAFYAALGRDAGGDTPQTMQADRETLILGEAVYRQGANGAPACVTCHALESNATTFGPVLRGLYRVAGERVPGLDAEAYVRQAIVEPNVHIVEGYNANLMYNGYGEDLTEEQIDALVAFVLSLERETR